MLMKTLLVVDTHNTVVSILPLFHSFCTLTTRVYPPGFSVTSTVVKTLSPFKSIKTFIITFLLYISQTEV